MGSTRLLTDEDGEPTDEYAYDAYGSTISHTGPTSDNPYQWVGALGYYTHYQAPEFKLLQLGFRFYDPEIGRFTQQDPIGDGLNWYAYCGGNPFGVDPWGLAWYDGWLNGDWGSQIPILGDLAEQAGTDWGNAESGSGSWDQAYKSAGKAIGGTVIGGVVIYAGGRFLIGGGARSLAGRLAPRVIEGTGGTGVVYKLISEEKVVYIGRTIDFVRRMGEWGRTYPGIKYAELARNLNYEEMRGAEQFFIERHGLANLWNQINGVAASNPNYAAYLDAAKNCGCK